jgi:polysaccharide export outer membrane protein
MIRYIKLSFHLLTVVFLVSCISPKSTIYLQDKSNQPNYKNPYSKAKEITENYRIQTNDYLYIRVITDKEEVSAFYNLSSGIGNTSNNMMQGNSGSKFMSYLVDDKGEIDFPSLGKVQVKGLTRSEVKQKFTEILKKQIDYFTLVVEMTDTYFTILGEANAGRYLMSKDQITIYEAIAISGDLSIYSKRKKVKIIRPTLDGTSIIKTIDLTDKNLLNSQESYIYPNDMIYVEPIKAKMFGFGETFSLGMVTSLISFYLLIRAFK